MNGYRARLRRSAALLLAVVLLAAAAVPAAAAQPNSEPAAASVEAPAAALPGTASTDLPDAAADTTDDNAPAPQEDFSDVTLRFLTYGGRSLETPVPVKADGSFVFPELTLPAHTGSVFHGWTTARGVAAPVYLPGETGSAQLATTYYARLLPVVSHAVTYRLGDYAKLELVRTGSTGTDVPTQHDGRVISAWTDDSGRLVDPECTEIFDDVTFHALFAPPLSQAHTPYLQGYESLRFLPEGTLTRAEAAQLVFNLLEAPQVQPCTMEDVAPDDWFAPAIGTLASVGIFRTEDNLARPNEAITRADFVCLLARLFLQTDEPCTFPDVPETHPAYRCIATAQARGWIGGYEDGTFHPDATLTRAEAACLVNRVLGRSADPAAISNLIIPLFSDVSALHWAYYDIMEATLAHTPDLAGETERWLDHEAADRQYPPGPWFVGSALYYIDESGHALTDAFAGSLYFGPDGRYTSGNPEMDAHITAILDQITTPEMTQEEKLRAAYLYTRDSFTYLRRNYYYVGQTGWEMDDGLIMLRSGRGNCYCYAAVFYYLSRQLGYDSRIISGQVGSARSPHGWVEIEFDGVTHIFDTELEMAYRAKGVMTYDFYMMPYARVPWKYIK